MSALKGCEDGVALYNKLGTSQDLQAKEYFQRISVSAVKHGSVYFCDMLEQKKKPLNNQRIYRLYVGPDKGWLVELFMTPAN